MLRDERFVPGSKTDRYGRDVRDTKAQRELKRLYHTGDDDVHDSENDNESDNPDDDGEVTRELLRVSSSYDPARDGGFSASSSEDEASGDTEEGLEEEQMHFPEQQGQDAPVGLVSARLAVVNLDWDNIRAADLMAVFSSFVPKGERILAVGIYPSEFGKQRMQREEQEGPPREIFASITDATTGPVGKEPIPEEDESHPDEHDEQEKIKKAIVKEDQGREFDANRLRQYQLERLRYHYGVLTCSSQACAQSVYDAIDGTEYLSTANFFDLRFVPDDMDFSTDKPRDECVRMPDKYRPSEFVTDALQHSKVQLTWDADNAERKEVQRRAFAGSRADLDENDLKAYLGSESSGDEASAVNDAIESTTNAQRERQREAPYKEAGRRRIRTLLGFDERSVPISHRDATLKGSMQVTFTSGLSGPSFDSIFENGPVEDETTVERYVRREKERKARRREKSKKTRGVEHVEDTGSNTPAQQRTDGHQTDLGFDDPFFAATSDQKAPKVSSRKRKEVRLLENSAVESDEALRKQAELESLVKNDDGHEAGHFNMNDIERAQRKSRRSKSKGNTNSRNQQALYDETKDDFVIDLQDPRFNAVYDRIDFAVDPSHPRYKDTNGMKALLENTRNKRLRSEAVARHDPAKRRKQMPQSQAGGEELGRLEERVRGERR